MYSFRDEITQTFHQQKHKKILWNFTGECGPVGWKKEEEGGGEVNCFQL